MVDRIKAAVDGRTDRNFVIMARTDALAGEGMEKAIARLHAYVQAGADMVFPEACVTLEDYKRIYDALSSSVPILANITEFGQTPLFSTKQLGEVGVSMALYPLSAFRAMSQAALNTYETIISDGSQQKAIPLMQTRQNLYQVLKYHEYEKKLDKLFGKK